MIECCGKSIKINYSDLISLRRENVACRCLRVCLRRVSVVSFVLAFSCVPLRIERKLRDGSLSFSMYFLLVYSPELFANASGRILTRKLLHQGAELMDLIDHEFVGNPTSPSYAFLL